MAFLSGVGAALVAALDRFKVGGDLPASSLGSDIAKFGNTLVKRLSRKNLNCTPMDANPGPTISDRMVNEVREVPGHLVGGVGRVVTFTEFVVKALGMNPSERLQQELTRLEQELGRREKELGELQGVVECGQIVLAGHKEVMDDRVGLQEQGAVAVQLFDETAEFENLMPTAEQIDEFMAAFSDKFNVLLSDESQFARVRNLATLDIALKEEVTATEALEAELAVLTKQYETVVQRRERANERLGRVNQQAGDSSSLLQTIVKAVPPESPLRKLPAPRTPQKGGVDAGATVSVKTS